VNSAWIWLALTACGGPKAEPEPTAEPVFVEERTVEEPEVAATAEQEAMHKALSARDDGPGCADVEALSPTPVEDLVWLTEHATSPPWVGTRAATCLIADHAEEVADVLRLWVTDPDLAGFGAVVLNNLGLIDSALAIELATLALTDGPDPEGARERIAQHDDPALQALLEE
jgi:hypothetical protein